MQKPTVIAEIGCNHKGDFSIASEMIKVAAGVGADVVKFQKRNNRILLGKTGYDKPHPNPIHSYGETYGKHRDYLEFDLDEHIELKRICELNGVTYSCSVWDIVSAKEIVSLEPEFIKIPSATNTHFELLEFLCKNYSGQIQVSLGMTTRREEEGIVSLFETKGRARDLLLYSCTSGYPVKFEEICLLEIVRLIGKYGDRVGGIGFSGHHLGIAADIAAMTLGAKWIERHFTLDRTWKGTDHAASLEPDGLRRLCRDVKNVHLALRYKDSEILDVEVSQRDKLKWHEPQA